MYEVAVWATVILMTVSALHYVYCAWTRKTNPVLATWILMVVTMVLSFWMYWMSPESSWTGNIGLPAALVNVTIILLGIIAANVKYGTLHVAFDRVQCWCLLGGALVVVFWALTSKPLASYVLVQFIALIAYFATIKRLWKAERSTEPIFVWAAVLVGSLCAVYPAWIKNDMLAWIYLARVVPSTALMLYLVIKAQRHHVDSTQTQ